ncbi:hypothetical protein ACN26Y_29945 [Micromonospora sp. WMMD558]|uniref:hypothetical protein n=1 Tax=Micromonospora sp. WMMD558 TaxID=3403462 RepID=UPI003BF5FBAE
MLLFHATTAEAADAIARGGFRDAEGSYMLVGATLRGVFVADEPLTVNEGCKGEDLVAIELPAEVDLGDFELVEDGKGYREWCVPAGLLNAGAIRRLSEDEAEAAREDALLRRCVQ